MSIWVRTSYTSQTMLSVRSQLLSSFNSTFLTLWAKSSKMSIFRLLVKQWFNLKLRPYSSTRIQWYENRALNFTQIEIIVLTLKNTIFNISSFVNSETTIGFMALKQVREWSQILILSPGWPCTQNEVKF